MGSTVQSEVEIINMALDLLVEDPIVDTSDNRAVARFMRRNYPTTRDTLLRRHPWNFAISRKAISAETAAPPFEYKYQYALPSDCLRLLPLTCDGTRWGAPVEFVVEGNKILTDKQGPLKIRWIARVENTALYDPNFVNALVHLLAIKAAALTTGKMGLVKDFEGIVHRAIGDAQLLDSLEGTPEPIEDSDIIRAR